MVSPLSLQESNPAKGSRRATGQGHRAYYRGAELAQRLRRADRIRRRN